MDYYVLDLDGPIYHFLTNLGKVAAEVLDRPLSDFPHYQEEWSGFLDNWGITFAEFTALFAIGVREYGLFWEGEPTEGSREGWQRLLERDDAYIHVVTDRSPFACVEQAHEATHYWLANQGFMFDEITFTADKANAVFANIEEVFPNEGVTRILTLDDKPSNCVMYRDAGFESVVFDLPMNRDLPELEGLKRVSSLDEFTLL